MSSTFRQQFAPDQLRHVVRAERGYWAFVPPPLPPDLALDRDILPVLSAADRTIGELSGASMVLPNPHLISNVVLRREAVLSSRIEGTQASLSDLVRYEAEQPDARTNGDVREVEN